MGWVTSLSLSAGWSAGWLYSPTIVLLLRRKVQVGGMPWRTRLTSVHEYINRGSNRAKNGGCASATSLINLGKLPEGILWAG